MKNTIFVLVLASFLVAPSPQTARAYWHAGFWVSDWYNCDCCWGEPNPWDPWWECPCYWEVWVWCGWHPYWMWPFWCRRYVEIYYSPCGRYYYVYYDYYLPGCTRIYLDGRYRYRYAVELERPYSITERIPRRNGLERPMPEPVSRRLESIGPEYRVKTESAHSTSNDPRHDSPTVSRSINKIDTERTQSNIPTIKTGPTRNIEKPQVSASPDKTVPEKNITTQSNPSKRQDSSKEEIEKRDETDDRQLEKMRSSTRNEEKSDQKLQTRTTSARTPASSTGNPQTPSSSKSGGSGSVSRRR